MSQEELHPLTRRILDGQAPEPLRRAAARGAVPVPRPELLRIQVFLATAGDDDIAAAAAEGLREAAAADAAPVLEAATCPVEVLDWFARHRHDDAEIMAALMSNQETPEAGLVVAARAGSGDVLDRILDNQMRLLDSPDLMQALEENPGVTGAARTRLLDLRTELDRRARVDDERAARAAGRAAASAGETAADEAAEAANSAAAPGGGAAPEEEEEFPEFPEDAEAVEVSDEDDRDALMRIMNMTVPEKVTLAMKGNREERAILVRDPIKVVSLAVMKSPKLTDREVESIAGMRNVVEDVIRVVADNREWLRNYAVVCALCKNPKTPIAKALTLMSRLNNRDLKMLGSDRNISEVVRIAARRTFVARTAPATVNYKKK